jgi:hypothetical protein
MTAINAFGRVAARLAERDPRLIFAGVEPALARSLDRSRLTRRIGTDNVLPATPVIFASLEEAVRRGEAWLAATDHSGQA